MNPKFKLILRLRPINRGFALPFAVGIGIVMVLAGTAMIVNSQSKQARTKAQQVTSQGLNAAQVGVARLYELINENRYLAIYPDCVTRNASGVCTDSGTTESWANASNLIKELVVCDDTQVPDIEQIANNQQWLPIDPNDRDQGEYRLISYRYSNTGATPGVGTLIVEGRVNNSSDLLQSGTQLEVKIPIQPGPPDSDKLPGVWLLIGDTGTNNTIQGDALISDCNGDIEAMVVTGTDPDTGEDYEAKYTNMVFPELPPIPGTAISVTTADLSNVTLPRAGDTPSTRTVNGTNISVYEYLVDEIDFGSGTNRLTITPGTHVTFYLQGSIDVGANSDILHSCDDGSGGTISGCEPTNFEIYGYGDDTNEICTSGNNFLEAFMFAPEYTVGVAGTGGTGGIKGSVWTNQWSTGAGCGSNTSNVVVDQTGRWENVALTPRETSPRLSAASTWKQNERE